MDEFDLESRVADGYYKTKKPYSLSKEELEAFKAEILALDEIRLTVSERHAEREKIETRRAERQLTIRREFNEDQNRLSDQFKKDAEVYYTFQNLPDPIKKKIHSLAEEANSTGECLYEYERLSDFAELCFAEGKKTTTGS